LNELLRDEWGRGDFGRQDIFFHLTRRFLFDLAHVFSLTKKQNKKAVAKGEPIE